MSKKMTIIIAVFILAASAGTVLAISKKNSGNLTSVTASETQNSTDSHSDNTVMGFASAAPDDADCNEVLEPKENAEYEVIDSRLTADTAEGNANVSQAGQQTANTPVRIEVPDEDNDDQPIAAPEPTPSPTPKSEEIAEPEDEIGRIAF